MHPQQDGVTVFMDSREPGDIIPQVLREMGATVEVRVLEVADYLCSERVAVERKSTGDFLQSIIDQRLFRQLNELSKNFERPVMIIEGDDVFCNSRHRLHPNVIRGVLASVVADYGVPLLWTHAQSETAAQIFWLAKREQAGNEKSITPRAKKKAASVHEMQEFLAAGLPNVSGKMARRLLCHFRTPQRLFNATEDELQNVDGVGKALSRKIREILRAEYPKTGKGCG